MGKKHKPRSGSKAFYPRKRAKKETPHFKSFSEEKVNSEEAKPLNFFGYKAGMTHLIARDDHQKSQTYGTDISVPVCVIECPAIKVFGVRAYKKTTRGKKVLGEVLVEKVDKHLQKRIPSIKRKKKKHSIESLEKQKEKISEIRLIAHTQPFLTGIGKKKPEVIEIHLSGSVEKQLEYAKQKLGKEIKIGEVFSLNEFVDVRAVTKGKGFQGVIKRFGVKMHRPKAKKRRVVGSISPWHPATVMWTVARPGQMGYHTRTEYNKRILILDSNTSITPKSGFPHYGVIKNEYIVLAGSIPGAVKRIIALRGAIRKFDENKQKFSEISLIATKGE